MFYFKWIYDVEIVGLSQTTQNNTNCVLINKRKKKWNHMRSLCVECSAVLIDMKLTYNIWHFIAGEDSEATKNQLTEQILEESCDKALNKADYNWDGYISWDEYVYSLGDKEVAQHVNEFETHETDHHKR